MTRPILALALAIAPAIAADSYTVDDTHAHAIYKVSHVNVGHSYGMFEKIGGAYTLDADPTKNVVNVTIATASVRSGNDKRDQHLAGTDFFDAKQFPEMTFVSSSWTPVDAMTFSVAGTLTIKGVAKPQTLTLVKTGEGTDPWGKFRTGFETSFTINRQDFGITYGSGGTIGDQVTITVSIEGTKN
jgi:polyisoprenoid-binding protein YceI